MNSSELWDETTPDLYNVQRNDSTKARPAMAPKRLSSPRRKKLLRAIGKHRQSGAAGLTKLACMGHQREGEGWKAIEGLSGEVKKSLR